MLTHSRLARRRGLLTEGRQQTVSKLVRRGRDSGNEAVGFRFRMVPKVGVEPTRAVKPNGF